MSVRHNVNNASKNLYKQPLFGLFTLAPAAFFMGLFFDAARGKVFRGETLRTHILGMLFMSAGTIRFVGNYDINAEGKFLWELLCQLRKFGVGRIVTKNEWLRKWPNQTSYMKIVRVQPAMDRWLFGGKLWAEWTFRGKNLGVYEFSNNLNRSDWKLIHRHEEESFTACKNSMANITLPSSFPLPPLQVLFAKKNCEKNGTKFTEKNLRAPLGICLDPEFSMLRKFITQTEPERKSTSIYDEVDPQMLLDLYGKELPVKVEAWNVGPAAYRPRFSATKMKVQEQLN
uniref:TM2 domain-containing protein n=1 Tax=Heterorhabditis bacteriophora TaxID=37862 RepID=A0A1I7X252_HETBA